MVERQKHIQVGVLIEEYKEHGLAENSDAYFSAKRHARSTLYTLKEHLICRGQNTFACRYIYFNGQH